MSDHHAILESFLRLDRPLEEAKAQVHGLGMGSTDVSAMLTGHHIRNILQRFEREQLSADDVEEWAEIIGSRDDIEFEPDNHDEIAQIIFVLANSSMNGALGREQVPRLIESIPA